MPQTPNYGLPYPVLQDAPNVPADMQALATATDSAISEVAPKIGVLLQRQVLGSDTTTVTFSNIDQSFTNLWLVVSGGITGTKMRDLNIEFNDDTSNSYNWYRFGNVGDGTTDSFVLSTDVQGVIGRMPDDALTGVIEAMIHSYSSSGTQTVVSSRYTVMGSSNSADFNIGQAGTSWTQTSPITKIDLGRSGEQVLAGSVFSLYGLG